MIFLWIAAIVLGYALGALPTGYLWVRLIKKQDITKVGSGRTGGTNAMRAGGFSIGLLTSVTDLLKGFLSVYFASLLVPGSNWAPVLAGAASVLGHNWSLWLYWWTGKLSGGAGTGPNVGAAIWFWWPVLPIMIPWIAFMVLVVGYASLASLSSGFLLIAIFTLRYFAVGAPWEYIVYSILTAAFVTIALRANIQRLLQGTERRVGMFAPKKTE